jgi:uncharacterized LabA/DUF88 family protein
MDLHVVIQVLSQVYPPPFGLKPKESLMAKFLYVDLSNLLIEGQYVRARQFCPKAGSTLTPDKSWSVDFGKLTHLTGSDTLERAVVVGSQIGNGEPSWAEQARKHGYEVIVHKRDRNNHEKQVDGSVATEMMRDAFKRVNIRQDKIVLVAGDKDYLPTVQCLKSEGVRVEVAFWDNASRELRAAASNFISLNEWVNVLGGSNYKYTPLGTQNSIVSRPKMPLNGVGHRKR